MTLFIRLARWVSHLPPMAKGAVMIGADLMALPLLMVLAYAVRAGSLQVALQGSHWLMWLVPLAAVPMLAAAGLYRTVVRYIEVGVIAVAGGVLAVLCVLAYAVATLLPGAEAQRLALLVFWFMAFAYVVTSRLVARSFLRRGVRSSHPALRAAIYGAGESGMQLAQAMRYSHEYEAACFLDDDPQRQRRTVGGLRVHAPEDLESLILTRQIGLVVVAAPSATAEQRRAMMRRVQDCGVPVKTLPSLAQMVDGQADTTQIRDVELDDLLGRTPVTPDPVLMGRSILGRCVLVTGAGGSIGSELCRQILAQRPARLVLLDHSEFALYAIQQELDAAAGAAGAARVPVVTVLGSVQDEALLTRVLAEHAVQTAYHAAAYKHVPLVEANIQQGLLNNVAGTWALARAVARSGQPGRPGVSTCILVSTDKAVRPTNVMGATKRIAELIFQAAALRNPGCVYAMVRFGNVLGSSGSVVPLFRRQLAQGGPITLTHPEITRYFMLIPEATQLVIQAGAMARGGEVFVLDMGEPVKIIDLARTLIRLSGLTEKTPEQPDGDIEIRAVGLRPGEKLYEELLLGDDVVPSGHPRILCARERHIEPSLLDKMLESLLAACREGDQTQILRLVRNLVPEYRPAEEVNSLALEAARKGAAIVPG
jgi:FlaA1/EpsC-like NDP-sugar epimerase